MLSCLRPNLKMCFAYTLLLRNYHFKSVIILYDVLGVDNMLYLTYALKAVLQTRVITATRLCLVQNSYLSVKRRKI